MKRPQTIAIAATFTAEPVEEPLDFWMHTLDIPSDIVFAPYNQVFQQLLDPTSLLSQNQHGLNVVLIRFEDWSRFDHTGDAESGGDILPFTALQEKMTQIGHDFVSAVKTAAGRASVPYLVCLCPASPTAHADAERQALFAAMETQLTTALTKVSGVYLESCVDLMALYHVTTYYDAHTDTLGHVPYTPLGFTALGTLVARKLYALQSAPHKVIVLDCDQTLWKGVCGEDGPLGVTIDLPRQALQQFMRAQHDTGMLLCLNSKNNEEDVFAVFDHHPEMPLSRDHILSWRINWRPKSENLQALAEELKLGLDSFIFIDDNPVECMEVQANCPEALVLQLPLQEDEIPRFLRHVWAFDRLKITEEDKKRSALYRQNVQRERSRKEALSLEDFLASLRLEIRITPLTPRHLPRVSQLTYRTNQFNTTTIRRSESEIQQLCQSASWECLTVEVSDRFGDYGLVGVIIYEITPEVLQVDTFLMSCRVLGRGVEHRILARLGEIAREHGCQHVDVPYIPTKKNQPALDFLNSVGGRFTQATAQGLLFHWPVEYVEALTYKASEAESIPTDELADDLPSASAMAPAPVGTLTKSALLTDIATGFYEAAQILEAITVRKQHTRPNLVTTFVAPQTPVEEMVAGLWQQLLGVDRIGVQDNFFELGGHSLLAVRLFAQIEQVCQKRLPLATLFEAPTVRQLAHVLQQEEAWSAPWSALVALQPGGTHPPLFCVHAHGGEVLFYRALAQALGPAQPFYALQAPGFERSRSGPQRIEDLAAHYLTEVRALQPEGPYFLGGYCLGAVIAFEMAQLLHAQGQQVALLAVFDAYAPGTPEALPYARAWWCRAGRLGQILSQHARNVFLLTPHERRSYVRQRLDHYRWRFESEVLKRPMPVSLHAGSAHGQQAGALALPPVPRPVPVATPYVPKPYAGRISLFQSRVRLLGYNHPTALGWGRLATDGVDTYVISGHEGAMFYLPHVRHLAQQLQACLVRARTAANETLAQHLQELEQESVGPAASGQASSLDLLKTQLAHTNGDPVADSRPQSGLLSQVESEVACYRVAAFERFPVGDGLELVYITQHRVSRVFPSSVIDMLTRCQRFQTLEAHAQELCRILALGQEHFSATRAQLAELVDAGLLISQRDVLQRQVASRHPAQQPSQIATVGLVTYNRIEGLQRALTSYIENSKQYGRQTDFAVADNSTDPEIRQGYRRMLQTLKTRYGVHISYGGWEEKVRFANLLTTQGGIPPEVVQFALFDVEACKRNFGANRNALLLHTLGDLCFIADDDTICRTAVSPELEANLAVTSGWDPGDYWFFPNRQAALQSVSFVDQDILAGHEQLLGRDVGSIIAAMSSQGKLLFDRVNTALGQRLEKGDGTVLVTFNGILGDCAWGAPFGYWGGPMGCLLLDGKSHERLVESEATYRAICSSREILRVVPRFTLSDAAFSITTWAGLDNRTLLPPCMPVGRGQDVIFGLTVWRCFTESFFGHVPWTLLHAPLENRAFWPGEIFRSASGFDIDKLIIACVTGYEFGPTATTGADRLRAMGRHLEEVGNLPGAAFDEFLRLQAWQTTSAYIALTEEHLQAWGETPAFWVNDVRKYLEMLRHALIRDDYCIPLDLLDGRSVEETRRVAQRLVRGFGQFLSWWPEMTAATKHLRTQGQRLALPI